MIKNETYIPKTKSYIWTAHNIRALNTINWIITLTVKLCEFHVQRTFSFSHEILSEINFTVNFLCVLDTVYHMIIWVPLIFTWISGIIWNFLIWKSCKCFFFSFMWILCQIHVTQLPFYIYDSIHRSDWNNLKKLIHIFNTRSQLAALKNTISGYSNSINICTRYFAR